MNGTKGKENYKTIPLCLNKKAVLPLGKSQLSVLKRFNQHLINRERLQEIILQNRTILRDFLFGLRYLAIAAFIVLFDFSVKNLETVMFLMSIENLNIASNVVLRCKLLLRDTLVVAKAFDNPIKHLKQSALRKRSNLDVSDLPETPTLLKIIISRYFERILLNCE